MKSLCGNSYGCTSREDGGIGEELDYQGVSVCGRCEDRAIKLLTFLLGEPFEWCIDGWVLSSKVMAKLEAMVLYQVLKSKALV